MNLVNIFSLMACAFFLFGCDDSSISADDKSSASFSSEGQNSNNSSFNGPASSSSLVSNLLIPTLDDRVVSYQPDLSRPWDDSVLIIHSLDSLQILFPFALSSDKIDSSCHYLGISIARGEGLSYFILSTDSTNHFGLTLNQIVPSLEKNCPFPQTTDWQSFLI